MGHQQGETAMLKLVLANQTENANETEQSIDEIARLGARALLTKALEEEVNEYLLNTAGHRDGNGHRLITRNGTSKERTILTGTGQISIKAPRVNDRREGKKFTSNILPPYMRKCPNVESVLPILYLKGLSANEFSEALKSLLGDGVKGLSKSTIHALKQSWERDLKEWRQEKIQDRFVYIWADGVYVNVRLGEDKRACLLTLIGVTEQGDKKLLGIEAGYRESKESWKDLFIDLEKRGLSSPLCIIGDGALGLWGAVNELELFKGTKEQRCWFHKMGNVLNKLPKRVQSKAKELLNEMMNASSKEDCEESKKDFERWFGAKYPKAVECLDREWDSLTTFFDFPAEHWQHIRTTNPIESTFATVKLRTKVSKGAGSVKMAEIMAFKLMIEAQKRWRKIRGHEEMTTLLNGGVYKDGELVQGPVTGQRGAA